MNQAGVLGRFIPDFGRIVALMQFNMYHSYTVDEHLIRAVGMLSDIEHGMAAEPHPLSTSIIKTIQHRRTLYVAAFLHDIAKGRMEDHSKVGASIARTLCPRFGMSAVMTGAIFLGVASLPPRLAFYPDDLRGTFQAIFVACVCVGLVHDLAAAATRGKRRRDASNDKIGP